MKTKRIVALVLSFVMLISIVAGCGSDKSDPVETSTSVITSAETSDAVTIQETKDGNNGRPYNLKPIKYDNRNDRYLNGINATKLPVTDKPATLIIWKSFSSTIMKGYEESEAIKEMEKRTGVKVKFVYPPFGPDQEKDNFSVRIASGDLPHIFSTPQPNSYPGGWMKAVDDGVFLDLTPYYDKGMMPNVKYLREKNKELNRDFVDDTGKIISFPMIDIVPSDPWSGLWVRQDWLDELGLQKPNTMDEWDKMLRAMKKAKGVAPLCINIKDWWGVLYNYMFAGSYESAYEFMNKDGKVAFGPTEEGYKKFLTKMNEWYKEGLIDPDFATRDYDSYIANASTDKVGAGGFPYGPIGQIIQTGLKNNPKFKLTPVLQPTSYNGQAIHLHQDNSAVRVDKDFLTSKLKEDGLDEIAVKWKDYWYSQDGGDLCSYGPEGVSYKWNDKGEVEWIYPKLKNNDGLDFGTLFPLFKVHTWGYLRDSTAYQLAPEAIQSIQLWQTQDSSWLMPDNLSWTVDESKQLNGIMTDIRTYRDEMTLKFIMGQEPLSNFDNYIKTIEGMNIKRAVEINQAALDRYLKR